MTTQGNNGGNNQGEQNPVQAVLPILPLLVGLGLAFMGARWQGYPAIAITSIGDLFARLSPLVFFALLIERTVEVVMSLWRSEKSNQLVATVQRLRSESAPAQDTPDTPDQLMVAEQALNTFRAQTLRWTIPIGWSLGMVLAAIGVRALSPFIDPVALRGDPSTDSHLWWFNACDIVFSGALLAGGADPIHKLLDLYRKVVEASSAKAAGLR
jgi:hypothetical protein